MATLWVRSLLDGIVVTGSMSRWRPVSSDAAQRSELEPASTPLLVAWTGGPRASSESSDTTELWGEATAWREGMPAWGIWTGWRGEVQRGQVPGPAPESGWSQAQGQAVQWINWLRPALSTKGWGRIWPNRDTASRDIPNIPLLWRQAETWGVHNFSGQFVQVSPHYHKWKVYS